MAVPFLQKVSGGCSGLWRRR